MSLLASGGKLVSLGGGICSTGASQSGQLPVGHFVSAKMSLTSARVILPRPDAETSSAAYTRNAHPSVQYVCPVRAQGGAYPHWFEIIAAPSGTTIGQFYNSVDYGIVRWTPTSGTQTFTIRIHDQDAVTVDVTWTVTVGTAWVFFSDAVNGNDSTGTGTFANPWQTYTKAASTVTTGKAICLRAGTYNAPTASQTMSSSTHLSIFAYPGESVTMDCSTSTANGGCWNENGSDLFVSGIFFSSGPSSQQNPRCFTNQSAGNRLYKWNNSFDNPPQGTAGPGVWDNQACWFLGDPGAQRTYVACVGNTYSRLPPSGNGYMMIDVYNTKYMVVDENSFGAPNVSTGEQYAIFIKGGGNQEVSARRNGWGSGGAAGWQTTLICFYFGADGSGTNSTNQEMCYNTMVQTSTSGWASIAAQINNGANNTQPITAWSYRNTVFGTPILSYQTTNVATFTSESDAIVSDATAAGTSGKWFAVNSGDSANTFRNPTTIPSITYAISGTECQGGSGAGILDANYLLTGTFRSTYLGLRGAEIA